MSVLADEACGASQDQANKGEIPLLKDALEFAHDRSGRDATAANEYAKTAAQTAIAINGGAAVALVAFLSKSNGQGSLHSQSLTLIALGLYGVGTLLAACMFVVLWVAAERWSETWRSVAIAEYGAVDHWGRKAYSAKIFARALFVLSICVFAGASICAGLGAIG